MTNDPGNYFLVKLVKGPAWKPGLSLDLVWLQLRHMRNLWRLQRMKKVALAGPISGGEQIRGIVVFRAASEDEVRELIESDPAVKNGRLSYQIGPL